MSARTSILLLNAKIDATHSFVPQFIPGNLWRLPDAREVELQVEVSELAGNPDSATLSMELWWGMRHTTGPMFSKPGMQKFSADDLAKRTVEGSDFGQLAQKGSAFPVRARRGLINFGDMPRLKSIPTFVGGNNPYFRVTVLAVAKD